MTVERAAYFQEAIRNNGGLPLALDAIQTLIRREGSFALRESEYSLI